MCFFFFSGRGLRNAGARAALQEALLPPVLSGGEKGRGGWGGHAPLDQQTLPHTNPVMHNSDINNV